MVTKRVPRKLSSQGQVTVPAEVRELLGVDNGGVLVFEYGDSGQVLIMGQRLLSVDEIIGRFSTARPFTEDLDPILDAALTDDLANDDDGDFV